nr:hypothetical protein [Bacteroidota bacterium]
MGIRRSIITSTFCMLYKTFEVIFTHEGQWDDCMKTTGNYTHVTENSFKKFKNQIDDIV